MISLVEKIKSNRLWRFHGGIHPDENKAQSCNLPVQTFMPESDIILPLKQHMGDIGELLVKVGDKVLKGQALTKATGLRNVPIHASTSGIISAIEPRVTAHASGLPEMAVVIRPDGQDTWKERILCPDYKAVRAETLISRILDAGIVGLGGAGFSAAMKLNGSRNKVEILIINGAECEPYITADDALMRNKPAEIIEGIRILNYIIAPEMTVIAIEDNKPEAIEAITAQIREEDKTIVRAIKTLYPSGGKKQLIKIITGNESPAGGRSTDAGAMVQNIATAYSIKRAIVDDEPLVERILTLTGDAIENKGNYLLPIGTKAGDILNHAGYRPENDLHHLIVGGSMMGFSLPDFDMPVTKTVNAIIAPTQKEMPLAKPEMPCIRCSQCADACPSNLLPQQLVWYAKAEDFDKCEEHFLFDCIECGSCAYVCPSEIPLVKYIRQAKTKIWEQRQKTKDAERAKQRVEAKATRLKRIRDEQIAARKARNQNLKNQGDSGGIVAAKAEGNRKPFRRADSLPFEEMHPAPQDNKKAIMAAAIARAKAKQDAASETKQQENKVPESVTDPKKAAVAAAIARAKAKQNAASETKQQENKVSESVTDPKKAAVAAAIARAKAKQNAASETKQQENKVPESVTDPKKAAVAAAIARAKAKQTAAKTAREKNKE